MPCETRSEDDSGNSGCRKEGINYSIQCQECPEDANNTVYIGETSTTGFIRGREHLLQYKHHGLGNPSGEMSTMGRHVDEAHEGDHTVQFKMTVLGHYQASTHVRQVAEAARINMSKSGSLINTRGERDGDIVSDLM